MIKITLPQIKACKDTKTLLENISATCQCADEAAFLELKRRYDEINIQYTVNYETFTINS